MRVAVFSDVHGNLVALERFIDATRHEADAYLCLGDVVDYGPWNDECLELVLQLPGIVSIEGNHERLFLGDDSLADEIPLVQMFFRCSFACFSHPERIDGLPKQTCIAGFRAVHTIGGRTVYPDTEISIAENLLIGHSHHQFQRRCSGHTLVNPGSVGQNRKWIDVIAFAVLDTDTANMELRSLTYPVDQFISEMKARRYPQACLDYYAAKPRRGA
ncbi:MAG: metallophosphoesterase family protein [Kiritimatiellae bacterium]|nr:metallophosphoesterase family protein [Kiritimatiellia bacterium]